MDRQLWIHQLIKEEKERCERLYQDLERQFQMLPKGSLLDRNGRMYRAFRENGIQYQKPITDDLKMQRDLKMRRYIKEALPALKSRINNCRDFLEEERFYDPKQIESYLKKPYKGNQDSDLFLQYDLDPDTWKQEDYPKNMMAFEEEHYTAGGLQVRSKSEALIGTRMEQQGLIFRYEPLLRLGRQRAYPDFEILLPRRRRNVYLEHFGRMDDPDYATRTLDKLEIYSQHGLYLGLNFFFTWEMKDLPLNMKEVDEVLYSILALDQ